MNTWDVLEPAQHEYWNLGIYPALGRDWTHGNSANYDADRDSYLLSLAHVGLLLEVDRTTGEVIRELGGEYTFAEGSTPFVFQHDAHWTGPTRLMTTLTEDYVTRVAEYEVDDVSKEITEVWSCGEELGLFAFAMGGAHHLQNGNILMNYGSAGVLVELTPECEIVWRVELVGDFMGIGQSRSVLSLYDGE